MSAKLRVYLSAIKPMTEAKIGLVQKLSEMPPMANRAINSVRLSIKNTTLWLKRVPR